MAASVRMLLVGSSRPLRAFAEDLLKAGHPAYRAESIQQAVDAARAECPDIILADRQALEDSLAFADALRDACDPFRPLVVALDSGATPRASLPFAVDEVFDGPLDAATALFRLEPLARLTTMRNEFALRQLTLSRLGVSSGPMLEPTPELPVLALTPDTRDADPIRRAVDRIGVRAVFCDDAFRAERMLIAEECGALVAHADDHSRDSVFNLCHQLRKNPRLFHLPVLLLVDRGLAERPVDAYAHGASLVLPHDVSIETLASDIAAQRHRQRRRGMLRERLLSAVPAPLLNEGTGLVNEDFMMAHLATLTEAHASRRRPLSLVVFAIRNLDAAIASHGEAEAHRLHGEVARWIQRLVRAEDTASQLATGEFAVVLPNTGDEDARSLMYRIDDVLSHTAFGIGGEAFTLWIASGRATARPYDSARTFLSEARATVGEPLL
ncbi:MAG: diguanylate cyclase domain-containing protein [Gemmatimonas sp.]